MWPLSLHLSLHLLCTAFDYNLFGQGLGFGFSRVVEIRSGTSLLLDFWVPVSVGQLPFSTDILLDKMTVVCERADLEDGPEGLYEEGADALEAG